jgi:pimeloyl-ACP methyl ester carboxylesterase
LALARELRAGPVYLVGNSRAGGVVTWAAAEAPELVAGMALIAPFARDNIMPRWQERLLYMALFAPLFSGPWGPSMWRRYLTTLYPTGKPDDLTPYLARVTATMREPGRMRALRATLAPTTTPFGDRLARVKTSSLIIFGTKDRDFASPETEARTLAGMLGGPSRVEMIEGAGHYPYAEMAGQTGALITAFLTELRDQRRAAGAMEAAHGA